MLFYDASALLAIQRTVKTYEWSVPRAAVSFAVSAASSRGAHHHGLARGATEESYVAVPPVFLVADGMGAPTFGDRARQAVARVLQTQLAGGIQPTMASVLSAVHDANDLVRAIVDDEVADATVAGVALVRTASGEPSWMAFTIGESSIYRWSGEAIERLTPPDRSSATGPIGAAQDSAPHVWLIPYGVRERFLLCSVGVTKHLDDAAIRGVLAHDDGTPIAERLIRSTLASGGSDSATAIVVDAVPTASHR